MKKLFAILMSFQLILSPLALAQNVPGTEDSDAYKLTGDGSSEGNKQYINSIMMTGSAAIGSNFIFCKAKEGANKNTLPTFSHYIFMGGAITLLAGEIAAALKQKKTKEENEKQIARMTLASTKPSEGMTKEEKDLQLKLLLQAQVEEWNNRDALQARMNWMTAAEVVYWLAVAGAATETVLYFVTKTAKTTADIGEKSVVPATVALGVAARAVEKAIGYYNWGLTCNTGENDKIVVMAIGAAYGVAAGSAKGAKGALMTGISTAAFMMMLNQFSGKVGKTLGKAVNSAPGRVAIFGVFAALADTTRKGYKVRRDRAQKNADNLGLLIKEWETASAVTTETELGAVADGETSGDDNLNNGGTKPNIKKLVIDNKTGKCLSINSSGIENSSSACSRPIKFNRASVKFKSDFLKNMSNKAFDMSEALASDDMGKASLLANGLAANAARVKAEALGLVEAANKERMKNGEKPVDFNKEVKGQLAAFSKMAQDSAAAAGIGSEGGLASLDKDVEQKDTTTPEVSVVAPSAIGQAAPIDPFAGMGGTEEYTIDPVPSAAKAGQNLNEFESAEEDVSKKSDVSIFTQVSQRYFLNYTKIFEKKKAPAPEIAEEPKKN